MAAATEYSVWRHPGCLNDNCDCRDHFGQLQIVNFVHATHLKFATAICTANENYYAFRMGQSKLMANRKQSDEYGVWFSIRTNDMINTQKRENQVTRRRFMSESSYRYYSPAFNQTRYGGIQFILHQDLTARLLGECLKISLYTTRYTSMYSQRIKLWMPGNNLQYVKYDQPQLNFDWQNIISRLDKSSIWAWNYHKLPIWKGGKFPWEQLEFLINGDDIAEIKDPTNHSLPYCKIDVQESDRYLYIRKDMIRIRVSDHPTSHSTHCYKSNQFDLCIPSMREEIDGYNYTCRFEELKSKLNVKKVANELYRRCDLFLSKDQFVISTRRYIRD